MRGIFLRHIAPLALRFQAARKAQFRLVSQTRIHYRDSSALSSGAVGKIHGGDRLPWLQDQNNFQSLTSLDWQIHVCGTPTEALRTLSIRWNLSTYSFPCNRQAQSAGFTCDAAYLIRPDGHIALAQLNQNAPDLEEFLSEWIMAPTKI
jgi:hypothetical protein